MRTASFDARLSTLDERELLTSTRPFTAADDRVAVRQIAVAASLFLLSLGAVWALPWPWAILSLPALVVSLVRLFVLQHDCGHHALFRGGLVNDAVGTVVSVLLGVPYDAWRTEHGWHHSHQGQLSARGIDRTNSPMTVAEAAAEPERARQRERLISPAGVFVLGAISLTVLRKRAAGFFPFRAGFRWPVRDRAGLRRSIAATVLAYAALQLALAAAVGPVRWLALLLPAWFTAAGIGGWLFWVQHNFERTFHSDDASWSLARVAVHGSSYLALPRPLAWVTADIGLHHVHHLNPRIPNYRLDEARRAIPVLASVAPLSLADLRASFRKVFWDADRGRMVSLSEPADG